MRVYLFRETQVDEMNFGECIDESMVVNTNTLNIYWISIKAIFYKLILCIYIENNFVFVIYSLDYRKLLHLTIFLGFSCL